MFEMVFKGRGGLFGALAMTALIPQNLMAQADQAQSYDLGSSKLEIVENADMQKELRLGDQVLLTDSMMFLDEQIEISGLPLRVGMMGSGGNSCGAESFIIWQAEGQVKTSRTEAPCVAADPVVRDGKLYLKSTPRPGSPGEVWVFDPALGLVPDQAVEFAPDYALDWADIPQLAAPLHPMDVLGVAAVYDQLKARLSEGNFAIVTANLSQLGSGEMLTPSHYAGYSCVKLSCDEDFAYLWIDIKAKETYVIWGDGGELGHARSPMEDWPEWVILEASKVLGLN